MRTLGLLTCPSRADKEVMKRFDWLRIEGENRLSLALRRSRGLNEIHATKSTVAAQPTMGYIESNPPLPHYS